MRLFRVPQRAFFTCATLALLSLVALQGCSDDDDDDNPINPGPTSTQLTGTFANANEGGVMTVTIQTGTLAPALRAGSVLNHTVNASAVLTPEIGAPVNLTGTYSEESDTLALTGGGYVMVGEYDGLTTSISGPYTGPNGAGFFSCSVGGVSAVGVYCGTFENEGQTAFGRWNIVVSGSQLHGIGAVNGGAIYEFSGTITGTGTTRTIDVSQDLGLGASLIVDGTLNTTTDVMGGTWTLDDNGTTVDTGSWTGETCGSGGTQTSQLTGSFVNADEGGLMTLTIASGTLAGIRPAASMGAQDVAANAVLTRDAGGSYNLTGFYNPETDTLNLAGSGYTMLGVYEPSVPISGIVGQYNGPAGPGFFACTEGDVNTVQVFCGTFESLEPATGRWNMIVVGTVVVGIAISTDSDDFPFEGTVTGTGTMRTITLTGEDEGATLTATGTLDTTTNTISDGTFVVEVDSTPIDSGTWGVSLCPSGGSN